YCDPEEPVSSTRHGCVVPISKKQNSTDTPSSAAQLQQTAFFSSTYDHISTAPSCDKYNYSKLVP
ncbi:unnamed protein product, partial [Clonostachys rhizophaga]